MTLLPPVFSSVIAHLQPDWSNSAFAACCAFVNTAGGDLWLGITKDGEIQGVRHPDAVVHAVRAFFHSGLTPPCDALCRTEQLTIDGKTVVVAHVAEGSRPPYAATLKTADNADERVIFVRRGDASVQASDEDILAMRRKSDPTPWDQQTARRQDLSFDALAQQSRAAGLAFTEANFDSLGITNPQGFFSNFGLQLSDQYPVETRVGFFQGTDKASPLTDRAVFTGSLLEQYVQVLSLLCRHLKLGAPVNPFQFMPGAAASDANGCREAALREALLLFFALRDGRRRGAQSAISVFSNRLELLAFGEQPDDASEAHLLEGVAEPCSTRFARLLLQLSQTDRMGFGLPAIACAMRPLGLVPELRCELGRTKIILPRRSALLASLSPREQRVTDFLKANPGASSRTLQSVLAASYATTFSVLKALLEKRIIQRTGTGRNTRYRLC